MKTLKREKDQERNKLLEQCREIAAKKKAEERELNKRKKRQREENALKSATYQIVLFLLSCLTNTNNSKLIN